MKQFWISKALLALLTVSVLFLSFLLFQEAMPLHLWVLMWVVIGVVQGLTNLWDYREYKKYHTNYSNGIQHTGGDTR
jgi:uncharacterized membrane protein